MHTAKLTVLVENLTIKIVFLFLFLFIKVVFAQDVYVGNILNGSTNGTVSAVDPGSNTVVSIPLGVFPNSIVVSPQGDKAYIVNASSNTVSVISTATKTVTATVPVCQLPLAAALNSVGTRLYVTCSQQDTGTGSLSVFDTTSLSFFDDNSQHRLRGACNYYHT
jgi:YVTN family beta-propeller protein